MATMAAQGASSPIPVDVHNVVRAACDHVFAQVQEAAGGIDRWHHQRTPASDDERLAIRAEPGTLCSAAVVDIVREAFVAVPDAGARDLSVTVVNQDHYVNRVIRQPGTRLLTMTEFETPYVVLVARVAADADDPADVAKALAWQDGLAVTPRAGVPRPFAAPVYDEASFRATCAALLAEAEPGSHAPRAMFGRRDDVDPAAHRLGTLLGWGGLPEDDGGTPGG